MSLEGRGWSGVDDIDIIGGIHAIYIHSRFIKCESPTIYLHSIVASLYFLQFLMLCFVHRHPT